MIASMQDTKNEDFESRVKNLEGLAFAQGEAMSKEQLSSAMMRNDVDRNIGITSQLKQDFNIFRVDTNNRLTGTKEELQEQIYSTDRYVGEV